MGPFAATRERENEMVAVYSLDLGLDEWFNFEFDYAPDGKFLLENQRRININVPLSVDRTDRAIDPFSRRIIQK